MTRRNHRSRRAMIAVVAVSAWAVVSTAGPSQAVVTAVKGSAYGYFASVSLFGGPANVRGPEPVVTLAPDASNSPQNASLAQGLVQFGPAIVFSTDQINVSTQGSLGAGGSVTSTASLTNINRSGQEVFTASSASSTCTATESGVSASTTINDGVLQTSEGNPNVEGDEVLVNIPTNPPPNYTVNGQIETVGDNFQYIFNEQIVNPDGSITVYAGHLRLLGPTAVGDVYWGKSECGVTATVTTTTSTSTTTIPTTTSTSTTTTTSTTTSTTTTSTTTTIPTTTTSSTTTTSTSSTTTTTNPLTCDGLQATIVGTANGEIINGTEGNDVIVGLGGDDRISGGGGDDRICGGDGNDLLSGGDGNDRMFGGAGNDDLSGGPGNDRLQGDAGTDRLAGGLGTDTCVAGGDATADCEVVT